MRAIDLGRRVGLSAQQIRNYEASGLLPVATRLPNGYRDYSSTHVVALKAVRAMLGAGWGQERATVVMCGIHGGDLDSVWAMVNDRHARLDQHLRQVDRTLEAIRAMSEGPMAPALGRQRDGLRIGEAAAVVGVATSAVRFWEQQGLLRPQRDSQSGYRVYDRTQMRRLEVVVLLRGANYGFEAIHSVLDELSAGKAETTLRAIEQRRREIAASSHACAKATAALLDYVNDAP